MARYTGPRVRISRRFNQPIFGPTKYLERRAYGPGMHGPKSRRKHTEYGLALIEKQKFRYYYGLMERQFRRVYERALRTRGVTGEIPLSSVVDDAGEVYLAKFEGGEWRYYSREQLGLPPREVLAHQAPPTPTGSSQTPDPSRQAASSQGS